jgi:hypothetical protein
VYVVFVGYAVKIPAFYYRGNKDRTIGFQEKEICKEKLSTYKKKAVKSLLNSFLQGYIKWNSSKLANKIVTCVERRVPNPRPRP